MQHMEAKLVLVLLALHFTAAAVRDKVIILYVSPSPAGTPCPAEPCHTLSEYAHNMDKYVANNTNVTFVFLPGNHSLDTDFRVSKIPTLVLVGNDSKPSSRVVCTNQSATLAIDGVSQLSISKLEVVSCGQTVPDSSSVSVEKVENVSITSFQLINSSTLNIFNSTALLEDTKFAYRTGYREMSVVSVLNSKVNLSGKTLIKNVSCSDVLGVFSNSTITVLPNSNIKLSGNGGEPGSRQVLYMANTTLNLMSNASFQSVENVGTILANQSTLNLMPNASMVFIRNTGLIVGSLTLIESTLNLMSNAFMEFSENKVIVTGGALLLISSDINFSSHSSIVFRENIGETGGALVVFQSKLNLSSHTSVEFTGNVANSTGGGVFISDTISALYCFSNAIVGVPKLSQPIIDCFFQVPQGYSDIHLVFENNSAPVGSDIYGGMIDICKQNSGKVSTDVFNEIVGNSSRLGISSPPYQLCYCNASTNDCVEDYSHNYSVHPGETLSVPVLTMGQRQGPSPATVIALHNFRTDNRLQFINAKTTNECSTITFTAISNDSVKNDKLFVDNCVNILTAIVEVQSVNISIKFKKCPPFFELVSGKCNCAKAIEQYAVNCTISNQSIARDGTTWIGYDNKEGYYVVHPYCPLDYCNESTLYITSNDTDKQCAHNRAGLLCGACKANYSLMIGTSHCGKCSNYNMLLLLFFAFAGAALVVLLLVLRLTVAQGTINGLIFYANILYIRKYQFLGTRSGCLPLNVFLAWLNLDFGIESCLYEEMDMYQNTWLQFLFPLYIWVLIGILIFSSSRSSWITIKLGTNPVAVLATLVLLSYNKILHTVITVFSVTQINHTNINSSGTGHISVWLYDANISFVSTEYLFLFVTALLACIFFLLPYALFLVFGQCLQARSDLMVFSWVNRPIIKCFLDNYHAPYQNKHRYWTGLLILARIGLLTAFACNYTNDQSRYMMEITSVVVWVVTWGWIYGVPGVYKTCWVGILDASFMVNLGIVSAVTSYCYSRHKLCGDGSQAVIGYTSCSLGVAFLTFIGILIYHVHLQVKDTAFGRKLANKCSCSKKTEEDVGILSVNF